MKTILFKLTSLTAISLPIGLLASAAHAQDLVTLPPAPENCVYLKEVTTNRPIVRKQVTRGNQNTDFAVPTSFRFSYYIPQFIPENNASYGLELYFKNNDGSNAKVFNRTIEGYRFKWETALFRTPTLKQPFQVNFAVSSARNNAYQIAILACR